MKKSISLVLVLFISFSIYSQEEITLSAGYYYGNQSFFNLSTNDVDELPNTSWDIAFHEAGIHVNESAELSGTSALLYEAPTNNFDDEISIPDLVDSLYNPDKSWDYGAFNRNRDLNNPDDYGWGIYNSSSDAIEGTKVFALRTQSNQWKKIQIISFSDGIYTMKFADLDGADETTISISTADFPNSPIILFSFETGQTLENTPQNWDLFIGRYSDLIDAGGNLTEYTVLGILGRPGLEFAQIEGVNPLEDEIDFHNYLEEFETDINIIGSDWKYFNLGEGGWVIDYNRVYFVKNENNELWMLWMTGYSGASSGNITFEKTYIGDLDAIIEPNSPFSSVEIFPNPSSNNSINLIYSLKTTPSNKIDISLIDISGKLIWSQNIYAHIGLNSNKLNFPTSISGLYQLRIIADNSVISKKIILN